MFAYKFIGRETLERLEPTAEIICVDEVDEMLFQLPMIIVVEALDGRVLDRSVHSLDLSIGPWMLHLSQTMLDIVLVTNPVDDVMEGNFMPLMVGELDAIAPTEGMSGSGRDSGARSFSLQARTTAAAMAGQGFSRM